MKKETIEQLWQSSLDCHVETAKEEIVLRFTRKLLLECAKMVCVNCKEGNVSTPTEQAHHRVHHLGKRGLWIYTETCTAPGFFIEGE